MTNRVTFEVSVRGYEMDATGRVSPGSLARVLEHARWQTLRHDDLGIAQHFQSGVVRAQRTVIDGSSAYPDVLRVQTWIGRVGRTSFDFVQRVERLGDGELVARNATTVVHMGPNGPAPVHDAVRDRVIAEGHPEVEVPPTDLPSETIERKITPRWSDQDVLQHVNQARYIDWLEDARAAEPALEHPRDRALRAFAIQYDGEARAGQALTLHAFSIGEDAVGFQLCGDGGRPLTRARVELA